MRVSTINLWFQPVWGPRTCGQLLINFSNLVGVAVSEKQLRDTAVCLPQWGTRTLPQGCTAVSLDCSSLISTSPPFALHHLLSLISFRLNLLFRIEGRSWRLNEGYFLSSRNGDTEKLLYPGAPQGPAPYHLLCTTLTCPPKCSLLPFYRPHPAQLIVISTAS